MIEVYRIPVPKDRLLAMPKDERVLFLLLGYSANQLSMLQKLLTIATNRTPETELEQHTTGTQTQMLVRLMVGALNEAWAVVTTRFLQTTVGRDYIGKLDDGGQQALDALKQQFGGSNILATVRNNFVFHHPTSEDVEAAFEAALNDQRLDNFWNLYFSHHGFNSSFFLSDLIYAQGIRQRVKAADLEDAQRRLMGEIATASMNLIEFAKAYVAAAWVRNVGPEMLARDKVTIDAPNIDELWLPFYVEVSNGPGVPPHWAAAPPIADI